MIPTLAVIGMIVGTVSGVGSLAMILRFYWLVYDRGGPLDLAAAAAAVQQVHDSSWAARLGRFLPRSSAGEPGDQNDAAEADHEPKDPAPITA